MLMVALIKECLKDDSLTAKVYINLRMVKYMKVNGKKDYQMDKVFFDILTIVYLKAILRTAN